MTGGRVQSSRAIGTHTCGYLAAVSARQDRYVPTAHHLEQHRTIGQGSLGHLPGSSRDAGAAGRWVASHLAIINRLHLPPGRPHRLHTKCPPGSTPPLGGNRAGRCPDEQVAAAQVGAQGRDLARVPIGRMWIAVDVVAVVPHDDRAQVLNRSENGVTGTHDYAGQPGTRPQELPVAALGSVISSEHSNFLFAECSDESCMHPLDIGSIWQDHHHTNTSLTGGEHQVGDLGACIARGGR